MKFSFKTIPFFLFLSIVLLFPQDLLAASSFSDLSTSDPCYTAVEKLVEEGSIKGYPDGTMRPDRPITRAELITVINRVFHYSAKDSNVRFKDVSSSQWFYEEVLKANGVGYINGYPDQTFRPQRNVTKEETCAFITRLVNIPIRHLDSLMPIGDPISSWADNDVRKIVWNGILPLDAGGNFYARSNATRGEVCMALARFASYTPPAEQRNMIYSVILNMKYHVLDQCNTAQGAIVESMIANMEAYLQDTRYDYRLGADNAMEAYRSLPAAQRTELKNLIASWNTLSDLRELAAFFFPEMQF
ncbi:MAG TPA: S-layer homology domain-containing protein [Clostridiales bacterium]|nr:S-layer homology domain-containing protein [Clostridiales bacterium]